MVPSCLLAAEREIDYSVKGSFLHYTIPKVIMASTRSSGVISDSLTPLSLAFLFFFSAAHVRTEGEWSRIWNADVLHRSSGGVQRQGEI